MTAVSGPDSGVASGAVRGSTAQGYRRSGIGAGPPVGARCRLLGNRAAWPGLQECHFGVGVGGRSPRRLAVVRIDWNVMVKKSALLLGLAILAVAAIFLFASSQLGPLPVFVALVALSALGARVRGSRLKVDLVPSSFPVGGNRVEQRDVVDVTAARKNPGQESVLEVVGASALALDPPGRQP